MTVRSVAVRDQTIPLIEKMVPLDEEFFTRREAVVIRLAGNLANKPWRVTDEQMAELRTEFTEPEIVEIILSRAVYSWGNILGIEVQWATARRSRYGSGLDIEGWLRGACERQGDM
ncbi:MAG TPA: hypothetical protein DEV93_19545 [Chloroflexi bacterium]|jgi:alkylhydroperoxidase family enzyme|nr:hypothetical protein [Chloroflexota bacterium]